METSATIGGAGNVMVGAGSKALTIDPRAGGLLIMRLGFAGLLIGLHGWSRLGRAYGYAVLDEPWPFVGVVAELGFPLAGLFAVASALSESIGALLLGLGFYTRASAALIACNMAAATFNEATGGDPIELPALYLVAALGFLVAGPGSYSLERWRGHRPGTGRWRAPKG